VLLTESHRGGSNPSLTAILKCICVYGKTTIRYKRGLITFKLKLWKKK
jgi:hypothetical protein